MVARMPDPLRPALARRGGCRFVWDWARSACESEYFRFELYRNGNLHIVFKRPDIVAKANKIVADFYGETFADARRTA